MAMDRTAAESYLVTRLGTLFTEVGGIDFGDPALAGIVDNALAMTGVSYDDWATAEIEATDVPGFLTVLRYAGLLWIYDNALNRVDIQMSDPSVSKNRSQFVRQMENVVKAAQKEAEPHMTGTVAAAFETGAIVFGDRPYPPGVEPWEVLNV